MSNRINATQAQAPFRRWTGWVARLPRWVMLALCLIFLGRPLHSRGAALFGIVTTSPNPTNAFAGAQMTVFFTVTNVLGFTDPVIFIPTNYPVGATLDTNIAVNVGTLTWTPPAAYVSSNVTFQILAQDTFNLALATYSYVVNVSSNVVIPNAPVIGPVADQTIDVGTALSFPIYATNTDNTTNEITFSLSPTNSATITSGTLVGVVTNAAGTNGVFQGVFNWTPAAQGESNFTVTATEPSTMLSNSDTFIITVVLTNDCPQYLDLLAAITNDDSYLLLTDCLTLVVTNPLVVTAANVTIIGGATNVITANNLTRLFTVMPGASLNLQGLNLQGGRSTIGGAIDIKAGGSVTLSNCIIQNNSALGANGQSGQAGQDDPNYGGPGGDALPGWPGLGGAICNGGHLEAYGCQFLGNQAAGGNGGNGGNGGSGNYQSGNGGKGGNGALAFGGAIYNRGSLILGSNCVFSGNSAIAGSGGSGGGTGSGVFNGYAGNGGSGSFAAGGAICSGREAVIDDCSFVGNTVQGGSSAAGGTAGGGYGVDGAPGGPSYGGAISMIGGDGAELSSCNFATNTAFGGNGGDGGNGLYGGGNGGDGGSAFGGCLYTIGKVQKLDCTSSECFTVGGTNGAGGGGPFAGRSGLPGFGGGLSNVLSGLTNRASGLTLGNPALLGGLPAGSYLPSTDAGSTANPDGAFASAMANDPAMLLAAAAAAPIAGPNQPTNARPPGASSRTNLNTLQSGPPAPVPAGGIGGTNTVSPPVGPPSPNVVTNAPSQSSAAVPNSAPEQMLPEGLIDFRNADLNQVLDIYSMMVNRTLLRPSTLPAPTIFLKTQGKLTMREGIQALEAVLALNGVVMVNVGEKFVKVLPEAQGGSAAAPFSTNSATGLPELGQYVTEVLQLTNIKPSDVVPVLQPFVKIPNGILPVDPAGILVLRDYAENVKRMLELVAKLDVTIPSEFEQEVIPIKYAKASDIASALNSLSPGGGGGSAVGGTGTTGGRTTGSRGGGLGGQSRGGLGGAGGYGTTPGGGAFGTPGGVGAQGAVTPGAQGGSSFTQRLQNIINRASNTTGDIQVLGQTKIISDERTNSLLIFASKADMKKIKEIISKLDVVLAQVLIETVIIEVTLSDSHDLGFSYLQHPQNIGNWTGVGALNNSTFHSPGNYLLNANGVTNSSSGPIPGGFSYLMSIGGDLDVAVAAVKANTRARILQRPRIQTSHNEPASIFVGESRPYPTSSYYGGGAYGGYSSIQQLEIGVSLDVTPLINPDGLVVMDIHQKIDSFEGNVTIANVGDVPITSEKEAQAKVSVRDHDTIILGGLIETDKNANKSGVPFLMDLPIFGPLFRASHRDEAQKELIILIRPTVLPTPEIAALTATAEKNKMPGVRSTERDIMSDDAQRLKKANQEDARTPAQPFTSH